jgi:predicted nuclease of predicted toxin-antitoxin system
LAAALRALGHDADTVKDEGLNGSRDPEVWAAARAESLFLITQDLGFSDTRTFVPGSHAGILLVRLAQATNRDLSALVRAAFQREDVASWAGCFVVLTELKVRVRRPGTPS